LSQALEAAAYDYTIYGGLKGKLEQISVDIITGKKSILSYLLKPIIRARSEALRER